MAGEELGGYRSLCSISAVPVRQCATPSRYMLASEAFGRFQVLKVSPRINNFGGSRRKSGYLCWVFLSDGESYSPRVAVAGPYGTE